MIADDLRSVYNQSKWGIALRGLFGIFVGIIILTRPIASVAALALVVALWALIEGIVAITHAFALRQVVQHWWVLLLTGLVSVLFGIAAIYYYPGLSLAFAVIWVAWWLLTAGALAAYAAFTERKLGLSWGWTMAWAVLTIIAGALALMYPGVTLAWLLGLLAAFGIIGGVMRLFVAFRMQAVQSGVKRTLGQPVRT
jgi:uncharacterized membrane protein HdeD (DUF308 family)